MTKENKMNLNIYKSNLKIISVIFIYIIVIMVVRFSGFFNIALDKSLFLVLHTVLEILSVLVSFTIFLALYNIYDFTSSIRNVIFANTFFMVGFLDIMHLLSYSGMPMFFTENLPQKATAFWIFARITMALGVLSALFFKRETKSIISKRYILLANTIVTIVLGYLVIYDSVLIPRFFDEINGLTSTKIILEYFIIFLIISSIYIIKKRNEEEFLELNINMIIALIIAIASELIFTMYINVHDSINLLGHLLKAISYFMIFKVLFVENIKKPYIEVSDMREELNIHVNNLEEEVKEKAEEMDVTNYKLKHINNRMLKELDAAKQIQMALIPKQHERYLNIDFHSKYVPWGKLSGDSYKYFKIDENHVGMFLIDVSGHGVSSAMLTIFADRVLTPFDLETEDDKGFYLDPKEVLKDFYQVFNESNFPDETHMVMLYGVINVETNEFTYSSAGHNCNPIYIKENGEINILSLEQGFPICKLGNIFVPEYTNEVIQLDKGDRILFFTDGVIEESNENDELYSLERLEKLVKNKYYLNSKGIIRKICDDLDEFRGETESEDDITMFIMQINESRD